MLLDISGEIGDRREVHAEGNFVKTQFGICHKRGKFPNREAIYPVRYRLTCESTAYF